MKSGSIDSLDSIEWCDTFFTDNTIQRQLWIFVFHGCYAPFDSGMYLVILWNNRKLWVRRSWSVGFQRYICEGLLRHGQLECPSHGGYSRWTTRGYSRWTRRWTMAIQRYRYSYEYGVTSSPCLRGLSCTSDSRYTKSITHITCDCFIV